MIKWFAYIVLLLMLAPRLSFADQGNERHIFIKYAFNLLSPNSNKLTDTTAAKNTKHQQELDDKKKVKEIAKARRQPKPEKIGATGDATTPATTKPKRQRRPEGMERPPEIPRRNGN